MLMRSILIRNSMTHTPGPLRSGSVAVHVSRHLTMSQLFLALRLMRTVICDIAWFIFSVAARCPIHVLPSMVLYTMSGWSICRISSLSAHLSSHSISAFSIARDSAWGAAGTGSDSAVGSTSKFISPVSGSIGRCGSAF